MEKLLAVDDDPGILRLLKWSLDPYELITAADRAGAIEAVRRHAPKVVLLDLGLPPAPDDAAEGLAALDEILAIEPATKVIVVSGNEERGNAAEAVGRGAWDFYAKPIDAETLGLIVARAFHVSALEAENRRLRTGAGQRPTPLHGVITSDPGMVRVCRMVEKVAPTNISALLLGESGTGKELLARALHELNPGRRGPFVAINCAAIPETLLESELFGHERGAFTGATRQIRGKIETAHGGTLFLDEIGDMPLGLQAKLLRFIEEREIERLGGRSPIAVDVRIVGATNQPLPQRIADGTFREDLFYRVSEVSIDIPALRERGDDVLVLARHFAEVFAAEQRRKRPPRLAADAVAALRAHPWRGNVRELENRIRRAVILADGPEITALDLDLPPEKEGDGRVAAAELAAGEIPTLREARERAERAAVTAALARTKGNLTTAAKLLGISRPTLYGLLRQHDIRDHAPLSEA